MSALAVALAAAAAAWLPAQPAVAAPVEFTAEVDRQRISEDDSVSLKLTVKAEGSLSIGEPSFNAPEFDVVNEYHGSYVESYYENGRFGMRNTRQITKVLRPSKAGTHRISKIQIKAGEQVLAAPDLSVEVLPGGAGTPPPRGYGGGGVGLRGAGKKSGQQFFLRAEIDKERVYKGEQVVVSYYLYRRARVFNIQVDKYPVLDGFLREDLEMPILGAGNARLETERVVLDGVPYDRTLLARYAAYPLKEGKLKIDSMALKFNYYPQNAAPGFGDDDEDPFAGFFRQMVPRSSQARSDQVTVEVLALPAEGKPASFTGGVGDFNLTAVVDKREVKANDAITVTVRVEGRGNVAAIGEPKVKWPQDVELYDSKGNAKSGHGGVGEKAFEFLLIPRTPGKLVIPPIEMAFFDPGKKAYATKTTAPIEVNVLPGAPGGAQPTNPNSKSESPSKNAARPGSDEASALSAFVERLPLARIALWACTAGLLFFAGWVGLGARRRRRAAAEASVDHRARALALEAERLRRNARAAATLPFEQVSQSYEGIANHVLDRIAHRFAIPARSMPRAELGPALVGDRGVDASVWSRVAALLEFCETVRFAAGAGVISELSARNQLAEKQAEAEDLIQRLQPTR